MLCSPPVSGSSGIARTICLPPIGSNSFDANDDICLQSLPTGRVKTKATVASIDDGRCGSITVVTTAAYCTENVAT